MEKGLSLTATDILCKNRMLLTLYPSVSDGKICQPLIRNNAEKWPQSPTHKVWKKKKSQPKNDVPVHACLCGDIVRCLPLHGLQTKHVWRRGAAS